MVKATRASCAVVFFAFSAIAATTPAAVAGPHRPRIVVEPVLSRATLDGDSQIRISIANDSRGTIVIDPGEAQVFARRVEPGRHGRHLGFAPMLRYPCRPIVESDGFGTASITNADGTTVVWSTPEPRPSDPPKPVETPLIARAGTTVVSGPMVVGEIGCSGGTIVGPHDVYAVVTWHDPGSSKRSRIVSNVMRVDTPEATSAR